MDETITQLQAYNAMIIFLQNYYLRVGEPDALGILLGGMEFVSEGTTRDPAAWEDWLDAINETMQKNKQNKN